MSSEDMRIELETFVNQGLEEGWCGWPTKGPWPDRRELVGARRDPLAEIRPSAVAMDWWFPRLAPVAGTQAFCREGGLPTCDFAVARRFAGNRLLSGELG
jgi:hypothetical protein